MDLFACVPLSFDIPEIFSGLASRQRAALVSFGLDSHISMCSTCSEQVFSQCNVQHLLPSGWNQRITSVRKRMATRSSEVASRRVSFESDFVAVVWHIVRKQRHALGSTSLTTPVSRCLSSPSSCCPWACSAARNLPTFALSSWSPLATVAMACVSICAHINVTTTRPIHKRDHYALYTQT